MNLKKTEFISFRTDSETKAQLEEIANKKKWTVSVVVREIVRDWLKEHKTTTKNDIRMVDRCEMLE